MPLAPVLHSQGNRCPSARWCAFPWQRDHFAKAPGEVSILAREFEEGSLHGFGLGRAFFDHDVGLVLEAVEILG